MTTYYSTRHSFPTSLPSFYTRFHQKHEEDPSQNEAIMLQPYRTTPLILPGAKINKNNLLTESYLRHHPNPAVRAAPQHDFHDVLMKQKVADSIIQRVVGEEAAPGKIQHKQFNSPIGLYSDSNIENTIKQSVPSDVISGQQRSHTHMPNKIQGYKKTVVFDPSTSATFKALHEEEVVQEELPAQPKVFRPNRMVPAKKPNAYHPAPPPEFHKHVNSLGESSDVIHQSNSFKRLMYHVLGETEY
jgi:hypothetical protein